MADVYRFLQVSIHDLNPIVYKANALKYTMKRGQ